MYKGIKVIVVEDEQSQLKMLEGALKSAGYQTEGFSDPKVALRKLKRESFDILITDNKMPGMTGIELIEEALKIDPELCCIIVTAYGSIETAVKAMKLGAYDYLTKPIDLDHLLILVEKGSEKRQLVRENKALKEQLKEKYSIEGIIGNSKKMQEIFSLIYRVAPTEATVLVQGESGTGKELIARAIHLYSLRKDAPFVAINCAAFPETLLESELFGHEKGAFTGASSRRIGRIEAANGGTLFLDEIGEISLSTQVKLLRFLQEREIERLGSNTSKKVDVRIIAATNRDLEKAMKEGLFREDLYWRLNVVSIKLPPLRERKEDLPMLMEYFIKKHNKRNRKNIHAYSKEFYEVLSRYDFPGNVRELENIMESAIVMARGNLLTLSDLPGYLNTDTEGISSPTLKEGETLTERIEKIEKDLILKALEENDYVQTRAAKRLGISERVLRYKMKKYGFKEK